MRRSQARTIILSMYIICVILIVFWCFSYLGNGKILHHFQQNMFALHHLCIVLSTVLLIKALLIILSFRTQTINLHQFFFAAALLSNIPPLIIHMLFSLPTVQEISTAVLHTSIRMYSGFYIAMSLFWFFSILCTYSRNMPYSTLLFLFALAVAFKVSTAAPIIYNTASSLSLYVGGKRIFVFGAIVLYLIILILYFSYHLRLHIERRIALLEFFLLSTFIIAMQILLFSNSSFLTAIISAFLIINSVVSMKRYFVHKL